MSSTKMKAAELAAKIVGHKVEQPNPVGLYIRRTGTILQRRNRDGQVYNLYDYEIVGGSELSVAQYKSDMDANGFNPVDPQSGKLLYKSKSIIPQSEDEKIPLRLTRTPQGFWQIDERAAILIRDMTRSGFFTESQIDKEVERLLAEDHQDHLGQIGE